MQADPLTLLHVVNSYAGLPEGFYTRLQPQPLASARLLHANPEVGRLLGLSEAALHTQAFLDLCAGRRGLPGGQTIATVYSGHQFGVWAGQLGDGRAHLLGEITGPGGNWELQLKGSGLTPYSRMGDGRAVVRSSVREYLASEAMAGLGIPTTRALALVVSDEPVRRETLERAAIVARVAPSFVRFGNFEHWSGQPAPMRALLDYVVDRYYPQCRVEHDDPDQALARTALNLLGEVAQRSARLVAQWQTVGFCHGVMNTDNMSILGLTLDYGPYGFMDAFQAGHICNHTDTQGRYAWNAQPSVMYWNLYRLAESLSTLGAPAEALRDVLRGFEADFLQAYHDSLISKFGWRSWLDGDDELVDDWWHLLHTQQADFTLSFRLLAQAPAQPQAFLALFSDPQAASAWLERYRARLGRDGLPDAQRISQMLGANPLYVLRNHLAQVAIEAAQRGDASEIQTLLMLLRDPYTERPGYASYAATAPDWARDLAVSCSS